LRRDSELWVGTTSGLYYFSDAFVESPTPVRVNALTERVVFSIESDVEDKLWIGTDYGLYRYSLENGEIRKFGKEDGLMSMEFNLAGSHVDEQGNLLFGTQGGLSFFNPKAIVKSQYNPELLLSGITLTGSKGTRELSQTMMDILTVTPDEYLIKITFSSVDLTFPNRNQYRYRLGSGDWIHLGNQNFVSFINLQPGEYDLVINGTNADQEWSTHILKLKLKVLPAWYRTIYAYLFYVCMFIFLIWRIFEARIHKLRRMNQILKEKETAAREVVRQKDILAVLNRNMTDSIRYAHRIQRALFPDELRVRSLFPDSFVMYRPKDIVSGDFYWVHDFGDNRFCIASVDCTGHGVPGALMSVIGVKLLQEIIVQNNIDRPGDILQLLDFKVCTLFKNHHEEYFLAEGMDLSLCIFDKNVKTLQYAGAINSIYQVHDGNLKEIKADRMPVGISDVPNGFTYTNHELSYQSGDIFYLFTDGYIDQFGGQNEQKFKHSRFKDFLASFKSDNMDMQQAMLENNFDRWRGKSEQVDDVLVIGIRMS
jgi:serine phosphatase RsbU (regulator of sigma subunit)